MTRRPWLVALLFLGLALGTAFAALPGVLASWVLTPDAVDYVGIAYNWTEGRGFVVPVLYSNFLPEISPPAPAFAVRAPAVSALFALPLGLGASIETLQILHVLYASLVGAFSLLLARRFLALPAALAFAIALSWSFGWVLFAQQLITEVSAVAVLLGIIACAGQAIRSVRGALGLAGLTLLGWLTRPNLGLMGVAVIAAAVVELGPRAALKSVPLWIYVLAFGTLQGAIVLAHTWAYGVAPYAHYGVMTQIISEQDASLYRTAYDGWWAFVALHGPEIGQAIRSNLLAVYRIAFSSSVYLHAGWIALPALAHALLRGGPGSMERRTTAFAALGFIAILPLSYGGFDPLRYPLLPMVCVWLAAAGWLHEVGFWLARRLHGGEAGTSPELSAKARRAARAFPLGITLVVQLVLCAPVTLSWTLRAWQSYREQGTLRRGITSTGRPDWSRAARHFCSRIDPNARVSAPDPWTLYLLCGNAGYWIPMDLGDQAWLDRYLDDRAPGYLISDGSPGLDLLAQSARLERVAKRGNYALYRVTDAPEGSRPWVAPPALGLRGPRQTP